MIRHKVRKNKIPYLNALQWMYEDGGEWWWYDKQSNDAIEETHQLFKREGNIPTAKIVIALKEYVVDVKELTQTSSSGTGRKIKRKDPSTGPVPVGICGMWFI